MGLLFLVSGARADGIGGAAEAQATPAVQEALAQNTDKVRACYSGNIVNVRFALTVQLAVDAAGRVIDVKIRTHGRFIPVSRENCVARTLRALKLPATAAQRFTYVFKWGQDDPPFLFRHRWPDHVRACRTQ